MAVKPKSDLRIPLLVGVLFFLALMSKEIGVALLLWAVIWWAWRRVAGRGLPAGDSAHFRIMAVMVAALALYLAMRYAALGMWIRPGLPSLLDNPLAHAGLGGRLAGASETCCPACPVSHLSGR